MCFRVGTFPDRAQNSNLFSVQAANRNKLEEPSVSLEAFPSYLVLQFLDVKKRGGNEENRNKGKNVRASEERDSRT